MSARYFTAYVPEHWDYDGLALITVRPKARPARADGERG